MSNNSGPKNSKIVYLFITFAILFIVVFSLGVIIGKGLGGSDTPTIDRSYEEEVFSEKSSESEMASEGSVVQDSDPAEIESDALIMDEETETITDDVDEQSTPDKTEVTETDNNTSRDTLSEKPKSRELTKEADSDSKEEETEEKESQEVSLEESPLENKEIPASKNALPKIDPSGRYTVQIGAFQDQSQANKILNSMKSKGYPAFIKQKESPDNKNLYRVRVGTFSTRGEAAEYGNQIKEKESGIKSVFITVNN